jgi:hypothetical protein
MEKIYFYFKRESVMTTYKITEPTPTDSKWICTVQDAQGIVAYARRDSEEAAISFGSTISFRNTLKRKYEPVH